MCACVCVGGRGEGWGGDNGRGREGRGEGGGDRTQAVTSLHSHMAQCPREIMVNDKEPPFSVATVHSRSLTHTHTHRHTRMNIHTNAHVCAHTYKHVRAHAHIHTNTRRLHRHRCPSLKTTDESTTDSQTQPPHARLHTRLTEHILMQASSSPAFCIGDTLHYSELLSGDVACTTGGAMHSPNKIHLNYACAESRHTLWCVCVCACVRAQTCVCVRTCVSVACF